MNEFSLTVCTQQHVCINKLNVFDRQNSKISDLIYSDLIHSLKNRFVFTSCRHTSYRYTISKCNFEFITPFSSVIFKKTSSFYDIIVLMFHRTSLTGFGPLRTRKCLRIHVTVICRQHRLNTWRASCVTLCGP